MKKKETAVWMAALLGDIGGEYYYLGNKTVGILLTITFLCTFWMVWPWVVLSIWGVIHAFQIHNMSDYEFDQKYNNGCSSQPTYQAPIQQQTYQQFSQPSNTPMEAGKSKTEKLTELKKLMDDGVLTQEEFNAEKAKILNA